MDEKYKSINFHFILFGSYFNKIYAAHKFSNNSEDFIKNQKLKRGLIQKKFSIKKQIQTT